MVGDTKYETEANSTTALGKIELPHVLRVIQCLPSTAGLPEYNSTLRAGIGKALTIVALRQVQVPGKEQATEAKL